MGAKTSAINSARETRALTDPSDGTLSAIWAVNEQVALIYNNTLHQVTVTDVDASGNATIEAKLNDRPYTGTSVKIVYPYVAADATTASGIKDDYLRTGQDGTIATISAKFDVAKATGTLNVTGSTASLGEMVALANQYAICKFSFTQSGTNITDINHLAISNGSGAFISHINCFGLSEVYVAMEPVTNEQLRFVATKGSGSTTETYSGTASAKLIASKFYHPTLVLSVNTSTTELSTIIKPGDPIYVNGDLVAIAVYISPNTGESFAISARDVSYTQHTAHWGPMSDNISAITDLATFADTKNESKTLGTAYTAAITAKYPDANYAANLAVKGPLNANETVQINGVPTSGSWILPCMGQWWEFLRVVGLDVDSYNTENYGASGWSIITEWMTSRGASGFISDTDFYYSSTEYNADEAWRVGFSERRGVVINTVLKNDGDLVRPFLVW